MTIAFTGIGHSLSAIAPQNPELARSGGSETKVFVIDKKRSWGNRVDWGRLRSDLDDVTQEAGTTTLGNSMGGLRALLLVGMLGRTQAIVFAPQWSVDLAIVPDKTRWPDYRQAIEKFVRRDLSEAFPFSSQFPVFFGNDHLEWIYLSCFAQERNKLDLFVIARGGHDLPSYLKSKELLYPVIASCQSGQSVASLLNQAKLPILDPTMLCRGKND